MQGSQPTMRSTWGSCTALSQRLCLPDKQAPFSIWFQVKTARPPGPGGLLCPPVAFSWSRLPGHTVCTRAVETSFVTQSFLVLSVAWFFWAGFVFFFYSLILSLALSPSEASRLPFKIPVLCPVSHLPRNSSSGLFLLLTLASTLKSLKPSCVWWLSIPYARFLSVPILFSSSSPRGLNWAGETMWGQKQ